MRETNIRKLLDENDGSASVAGDRQAFRAWQRQHVQGREARPDPDHRLGREQEARPGRVDPEETRHRLKKARPEGRGKERKVRHDQVRQGSAR